MKFALLVVLLLLPSALAAEVAKESSGVTRGGTAYIFFYEEPFEETVISGVIPNDVITIQHPGQYRPNEYRMFMKGPFGKSSWRYDILDGGERALSLELGEQRALDIDNDGEAELLVEYAGANIKKGTFIFTSPHTPQESDDNNAPADVPEVAEEVMEEETGFDDLGLVRNESEPPAVPPKQDAKDYELVVDEPDYEPSASGKAVAGVLLALLLVVLGIIVYIFVKTKN